MFDEARERLSLSSLVPARVVRVDGPLLRVRSSAGDRLAQPSGRLKERALAAADLPTVAAAALLPERSTGVLLGPSGAGKSTLVNALLAEERMTTSPVREDDGRGRHTTSHRELIVLAHGGLLIDGPGLREVGLLVDESSLEEAFADVSALASGCRFRDCAHEEEPGCAVREGVRDGSLDEKRYASFLKLRREAAYGLSKIDEAAGRERKARAKKLSGLINEALRRKGRR